MFNTSSLYIVKEKSQGKLVNLLFQVADRLLPLLRYG